MDSPFTPAWWLKNRRVQILHCQTQQGLFKIRWNLQMISSPPATKDTLSLYLFCVLPFSLPPVTFIFSGLPAWSCLAVYYSAYTEVCLKLHLLNFTSSWTSCAGESRAAKTTTSLTQRWRPRLKCTSPENRPTRRSASKDWKRGSLFSPRRQWSRSCFC